ncbi:MAG: hypothetical protein HOF15_17995, partial [Planctomycetaceae bacterium]|nr:hypothetical protein [Planctomycetaceae bacterium]
MKALLPALAAISFLSIINLSAIAHADPDALVDRFGKLNAAEQTKLSESINGDGWKRLNPVQRLALQKAAVSYSERVLGRDEKGNLKI